MEYMWPKGSSNREHMMSVIFLSYFTFWWQHMRVHAACLLSFAVGAFIWQIQNGACLGSHAACLLRCHHLMIYYVCAIHVFNVFRAGGREDSPSSGLTQINVNEQWPKHTRNLWLFEVVKKTKHTPTPNRMFVWLVMNIGQHSTCMFECKPASSSLTVTFHFVTCSHKRYSTFHG
jgi:hypothetical protein